MTAQPRLFISQSTTFSSIMKPFASGTVSIPIWTPVIFMINETVATTTHKTVVGLSLISLWPLL